jgi:hypothetical protein
MGCSRVDHKAEGSAGSSASDKAFIAEQESQNVTVTIIQSSVSELTSVNGAIDASEHQARGILQMSTVLRDQSFLKMSSTEWSEAVTPKIQGTMNLHEATKDTELDFVLFGSLSGVIGMPGQANYAAANTFLDGFVQYRHHLGLTASAIDIGAMEDVGYLAHNAGLATWLKGDRRLRDSRDGASRCAHAGYHGIEVAVDKRNGNHGTICTLFPLLDQLGRRQQSDVVEMRPTNGVVPQPVLAELAERRCSIQQRQELRPGQRLPVRRRRESGHASLTTQRRLPGRGDWQEGVRFFAPAGRGAGCRRLAA